MQIVTFYFKIQFTRIVNTTIKSENIDDESKMLQIFQNYSVVEGISTFSRITSKLLWKG